MVVSFSPLVRMLRSTLGDGIPQPSRLVPSSLIRAEQAISAQQEERGNQAAPKSPSPSRSENLTTTHSSLLQAPRLISTPPFYPSAPLPLPTAFPFAFSIASLFFLSLSFLRSTSVLDLDGRLLLYFAPPPTAPSSHSGLISARVLHHLSSRLL